MQSNHVVVRGDYRDEPGRRREDWLPNSLITGFAATFVMTVVILAAYWFVRGVGDTSGSKIERWFAALHNNSLTRSTGDSVFIAIALNLAVGVAWAIAYGYFGAPKLIGTNWRKGLIFAFEPFLLSVLVFFQIMDAGVLGSDLGAGPFPVLGNLILHVTYGAVLGSLFAVDLEGWLDDSEADLHSNRVAESGMAYGLLIGAPIGMLAAWAASPTSKETVNLPIAALLGTILGTGLGLMVGFFGDWNAAAAISQTDNRVGM